MNNKELKELTKATDKIKELIETVPTGWIVLSANMTMLIQEYRRDKKYGTGNAGLSRVSVARWFKSQFGLTGHKKTLMKKIVSIINELVIDNYLSSDIGRRWNNRFAKVYTI